MIGGKLPNAVGAYDMSGNTLTWCWDWFGAYVDGSPFTDADTMGPASGTTRTLRGGSYNSSTYGLQLSLRTGNYWPNGRDNAWGLRVACAAP